MFAFYGIIINGELFLRENLKNQMKGDDHFHLKGNLVTRKQIEIWRD